MGPEGSGLYVHMDEACQRTELLQPPLETSPISPFSLSCCIPHSATASCITFGVGGREHVSILGADSLFPALQGVKITPRWHRSGPRQYTSKSSSLVYSPPTLHSGVEGTTNREKTPSGQEWCRRNLVGVGAGEPRLGLAPCVV